MSKPTEEGWEDYYENGEDAKGMIAKFMEEVRESGRIDNGDVCELLENVYVCLGGDPPWTPADPTERT